MPPRDQQCYDARRSRVRTPGRTGPLAREFRRRLGERAWICPPGKGCPSSMRPPGWHAQLVCQTPRVVRPASARNQTPNQERCFCVGRSCGITRSTHHATSADASGPHRKYVMDHARFRRPTTLHARGGGVRIVTRRPGVAGGLADRLVTLALVSREARTRPCCAAASSGWWRHCRCLRASCWSIATRWASCGDLRRTVRDRSFLCFAAPASADLLLISLAAGDR